MKKIRIAGAVMVAVLWLGLTASAWLLPSKDISESERRKLAQFPKMTVETLLGGKFMSEFETYTLDQFPLRDTFRQAKALFHYNILDQTDNNDIILEDGYAAKLEYPMSNSSLDNALEKFQALYDSYLTDSKVYAAIVPDKNLYIQGYLSMDYDALYGKMEAGMPWASFVDLREQLSLEDYYRTDTHWRQEKLLPAAGALCSAMGVSVPREEVFTPVALERPFYGVYYGQAALPMDPEKLYIMESDWLKDCTVTNFETGMTTSVYDMDKLDSRDLYDVFLSGAVSLLEIHNPHGQSGRELIVFRDSFGSSMVPLIMGGYETVTVIDTRYIASDLLGQYVDFHGQDVLFLYSTLILNGSSVLK